MNFSWKKTALNLISPGNKTKGEEFPFGLFVGSIPCVSLFFHTKLDQVLQILGSRYKKWTLVERGPNSISLVQETRQKRRNFLLVFLLVWFPVCLCFLHTRLDQVLQILGYRYKKLTLVERRLHSISLVPETRQKRRNFLLAFLLVRFPVCLCFCTH